MDNKVSFGLTLIRVALGLMLATHGLNKVFGKGGIQGTAGWFEALGLRPGYFHACVAAATEIGAGLLMCVGLLFPLPSAAFVGLMVTATLTDHRGKGFFVFKGGWEYTALIAVIAAAVGFTGPGRWSLDRVAGIHTGGWGWGVAAVLVGLVAGIGTVAVFRRPVVRENPS
jgi:putative oxidoreductase